MNKVKYVLASACVSAVGALAPTAKAEPMTHDGFYLAPHFDLGCEKVVCVRRVGDVL